MTTPRWTLRHTETTYPGHYQDGGFWYAYNSKTGGTVSASRLADFEDPKWLKRKGLPSYLAKEARRDPMRWFDRLYTTGEAPDHTPGGVVTWPPTSSRK